MPSSHPQHRLPSMASARPTLPMKKPCQASIRSKMSDIYPVQTAALPPTLTSPSRGEGIERTSPRRERVLDEGPLLLRRVDVFHRQEIGRHRAGHRDVEDLRGERGVGGVEMLHRLDDHDLLPGDVDSDMAEAVDALALVAQRVADDGDAAHVEGSHVADRRVALVAAAEADIGVALEAGHGGAQIEGRTGGRPELAAEAAGERR